MTTDELYQWHIDQQRLYQAKIRAHMGVKPSIGTWRVMADFHGNAANAITYETVSLEKFNKLCNEGMLTDEFVKEAGYEPSFTDGMTWKDAAIHELAQRKALTPAKP